MGRQRFFGNKSHGVIFIDEGLTPFPAEVTDGELIVIGNKTYEFDDAGGVGSGNIAVTIAPDGDGTAAAATIANLIAAINANKPSVPVTATVHPTNPDCCVIVADLRGAAGNMIFTTTMATGTSSISGTGLLEYGENGGSQTEARGEYVFQTEDLAALGFVIDTGLQTPRFKTCEVRSATGVFKAYDGAVALVGAEIQGDQTGAVDLIVGDIITWGAWE